MPTDYNYSNIPVPPLLKSLPDPPKTLYAIGEGLEALLTKPRVAIVGTRKMSPYGKAITETLAYELSRRGVVIVSGLAYGVDSCAHRATVATGGEAIAVLANGLDQIYPAAHVQLAEQIIKEGGVILSEYPAKTEPLAFRFLERNRLISGLADAIVVTEAAERSGTMNTTAHALNQGKVVMAVPGNTTSLLSAGTNNLIKAGAIPVTSVEDILAVLDLPDEVRTPKPIAANQQEFILLSLIGQGITDGAELLRHSDLSTAVFNQTLTMLEITAKIKPLGGNHWTLC